MTYIINSITPCQKINHWVYRNIPENAIEHVEQSKYGRYPKQCNTGKLLVFIVRVVYLYYDIPDIHLLQTLV